MKHMKRRELIKSSALGLSAAMLPFWSCSGASAQSPKVEMVAKEIRHQLMSNGPLSSLWAFETSHGAGLLGKALRYQLGDTLNVNLSSETDDGVSVHWHGLRLPNGMDGTEMVQMGVRPGQDNFEYDFEVFDPGTHWFHSHQRSWDQVARGLYGMVIVSDPNEPDLHDIPLILDDWRLDSDGRQDVNSLGDPHDWSHAGRTGNFLTVNGHPSPLIEVPREGWLRLRFLNAATAIFFAPSLEVSNAKIVAFDGFSVRAQDPSGNSNLIGPGQRLDLVIDARQLNPEGQAVTQNGRTLATLKPSDAVATSSRMRNPYRAFREYSTRGLEPAANPTQQVTLTMNGGAMGGLEGLTLNNVPASMAQLRQANRFWGFNGKADGMQDPSDYAGWDEPLFRAHFDETIHLTLVNDTNWHHTIHVHGQHFRVLENHGLPHEQGLFRDSVNVVRGDRVKIAMRANAVGWWPIHCHMLGHQAAGMATWYNVG